MDVTWALRDAPTEHLSLQLLLGHSRSEETIWQLQRALRVPRSCRPGNNGQSRQLLLLMRAFSTLYKLLEFNPAAAAALNKKI